MNDLCWAVRDGHGYFTLWSTEKKALEIQASNPGSDVTACELVSDPAEVSLKDIVGTWFNRWVTRRTK